MNVQIEQRKVAGVAIEASRILADKGFNRGEIILGLSELIGRTIVDSVQDTLQYPRVFSGDTTRRRDLLSRFI